MRVGCFAFAIALAASALTAEAWSPPYQTTRLVYDASGSVGLRSDSSMSLDGVDAFTIRFTGVQFNWDFRHYGQLFRMKAPNADNDVMIGFTGEVYAADKQNKLVARLAGGGAVDVYGESALPEQAAGFKGLDVVVAFNGTDARLTLYVDGSTHAVSVPQVDSTPYSLPNHVKSTVGNFAKFFSGNGNAQNSYYELSGSHETLTVWAGVALDATTVREAHEGLYANVPTPSHHYSFCEGGAFTTELDVVSDLQTNIEIADHITGDSAHSLLWTGKFERFREAPAEGAAFVGAMSECCEGKAREFGFVTRASGGTFRTTVDALGAESVDEGRRCHAPP